MSKLVAIPVVAVVLLAVGCSNPSAKFAKLSEEYVYSMLAFTPSAATGAGLHQYDGKNLDDLLDDLSPANTAHQRAVADRFRQRLAELNPDKLTREDRADLAILQDQISLVLLDADEIHSTMHNPTIYVEALGNALFTPYVLEYAPLPARMRSIIARLEKVPLFLDQAQNNLVSSPEIWTKVALEENLGNIDLVDKTLRQAATGDLRDAYTRAAAPALRAMQAFQQYLTDKLSGRNDASWRLGQLYPRKFQYVMQTGMDAANTLQKAEEDLQRVRARMLELALPLHREMAPGHRDHAELPKDAQINQVVGEVLSRIALRHATREGYLDEAKKDLEEARAFVQAKHLLSLPQRANLQVIPTPDFMRGVYSVGGFNPAPTLEPQLGAFYWVTPIDPGWPKERAESKLREYNFYKLKLLTIHEAMPGHYVQAEFANDVQPASRRVLRAVFGSGPYVEGWAQFATQTMLDEGFLNHSPEMALTFAKEELRVIANAILDIRLQMLNMTDQEALDLMQKQTFQEAEEATEKLQRAKLSSCQLPTYFAGWRGWVAVRDAYRQAKGSAFSVSDFNDRALKEGAVPLTVLGQLLQ